ncbi:hypothetical protein J1N35_031702 [Gossypium stocksii]|uniref:Uncharacterized protein n=1 Tax=Gossypium stocksii TaxID=47602 RepID=A0A9D3ZVK6_9ROSI|nr:hypothetical protein J1N35_031702 [Gossypium stocksii]
MEIVSTRKRGYFFHVNREPLSEGGERHLFDTMKEDVKSWSLMESISPSMEPSSSPPPAELIFLRDTHFALHGEIWLVTVVLIFALFFAFVVFLPRLRLGRRSSESQASDSDDNITRRRSCPLTSSRKPRRFDDDDADQEQQYLNRINHKFPL